MVIRIAIVALWIVAIGWTSNFLSLLFGATSTLLLLLAGGATAFVGVARFVLSWQAEQKTVEPTPGAASSAQIPARPSY